ncbi:MAG: M20/M25/M40 family metallo-hydrolase [Chloroflexi bacterium]|nr:M20/M25/M40 family metallo-hydrolase [Chloroflexota bacterium]
MEVQSEGESGVELLSPQGLDIEAHPLRTGAEIPRAEVEGELMKAGLGFEDDFTAGVGGKIALVERGILFFNDKVANAAEAGATAVVIYNNRPGPFYGTSAQELAVPAVTISREDGQALLGLLEDGTVRVRLVAGLTTVQATSHNVAARPPGGECEVIVGGHYDSVPAGPGANDNASGTATALEIARVLSGDKRFEDVCFVLFGAEEIGLFGSRHYVESISSEEREAIRGMVNIDQIGVGRRWLLSGSEELTAVAARAARRAGLSFVVGSLPANASSDHAPFIAAGIPAFIIHRSGDTRAHTAEDVSTHVRPELLKEAAAMALAVVRSLVPAP